MTRRQLRPASQTRPSSASWCNPRDLVLGSAFASRALRVAAGQGAAYGAKSNSFRAYWLMSYPSNTEVVGTSHSKNDAFVGVFGGKVG